LAAAFLAPLLAADLADFTSGAGADLADGPGALGSALAFMPAELVFFAVATDVLLHCKPFNPSGTR